MRDTLPITTENLTQSLKSESAQLGFELVGACAAVQPTGLGRFEKWLRDGYSGEMTYLTARQEAYRHPSHVLDGAVSVLMLGLNYRTQEAATPSSGQGKISRYAWGQSDYHDLIHDKLKKLVTVCKSLAPDARIRGVIDTAPLLEREFAQMAGLGWHAKNTMLINRQLGSWFFLAALLLDVPLIYDEPHQTSHCGTCTACIDACPTDAFVEPHVLDARRCISYLTIELRDSIPLEFRPAMDTWVFGCDICQDVCPWNSKAPQSTEKEFIPLPERNPLDLIELFYLTDEQFRDRFRRTALWRPRRRGLVRNAAIALGNHPSDSNIDALSRGISDDEELIRGASAWALGHHTRCLAEPVLEQRLAIESVPEVADEIRYALRLFN